MMGSGAKNRGRFWCIFYPPQNGCCENNGSKTLWNMGWFGGVKTPPLFLEKHPFISKLNDYKNKATPKKPHSEEDYFSKKKLLLMVDVAWYTTAWWWYIRRIRLVVSNHWPTRMVHCTLMILTWITRPHLLKLPIHGDTGGDALIDLPMNNVWMYRCMKYDLYIRPLDSLNVRYARRENARAALQMHIHACVHGKRTKDKN